MKHNIPSRNDLCSVLLMLITCEFCAINYPFLYIGPCGLLVNCVLCEIWEV
jgi:hypothetical protein